MSRQDWFLKNKFTENKGTTSVIKTYPLIILGAGASYDFTHPTNLGVDKHEKNPTFPKTDYLLDEKYVDHEIESLYDGFKTLRSRFISPIRKSSFEKCLEGWDDQEQLSALRLYLGDYFWKKSQDKVVKEKPTNFRALVDYIKKSPMQGAFIVTFNYDVLLENELGLNRFFDLSNYIDGSVDNIRIIKIHGSCDWYHPMSRVAGDIYTALCRHPEFLNKPNLQILTKRWLDQPKSGANQFFNIPVISLPTTSTKNYVCPNDHIQSLNSALTEIYKILIIGWKAGDSFLLEKLKAIEIPIDLTVVSGSEKGAKEVAEVIEKYVPSIGRKTLFKEGFSDFIGSAECDAFFNETT